MIYYVALSVSYIFLLGEAYLCIFCFAGYRIIVFIINSPCNITGSVKFVTKIRKNRA